ncbi:efflux RND transporter periplasmic adaptor subunit [Temperatibacter marinus]|uniref:Efflux RND transporter periplasmic adaptor subunit n=1 Tax=Temperatibacter marinus TaxID=1456591 RepID=A0AA52HAL2_9PROT|nr:efflux RND transporter periplasmic adaptor subunit [Temperatibacter marinus]WND04089.1 efflux RND transporter periplasmic adaptor subunit [Temperatibacter marinus]
MGILKSKVGIFSLIFLGVAVAWFFMPADAQSKNQISYQAKPAEKGTITRKVSASGAVDAVTMVEISTEVSGLIREINADFNTQVKEGEVLAVINPQIFQSRVTQRRAELAVAEASIGIQKAQLSNDEASLKKLRRDLKRTSKLFEQNNISEAALDNANLAVETAARRVEMAKAQLKNAYATVTMRQASLEQAEIDLDRTNVKSPIDGIVIERAIEIGQTVAASLSAPKLFRIAKNLEEIEIEASIDEADIGNVKEGNQVSFTVDAHQGRTFTGTVQQVRLAPKIEQNVVTYTVVVTARNDQKFLLPGMTANVDIVTGVRSDALRVPNAALRFKPRGQKSSQAQSGGQGNAMMTRFTEGVIRQAGLNKEQAVKFKKAMEKPMQEASRAMRQGSGGFDGSGARAAFQKLRADLSKTLEEIATPEQMAAYQAASQQNRNRGRRSARSSNGRPGSVWIKKDDGTLEERRVMVGITDGSHSEILRGQLKAGENVVVSARVVKSET